MTVPRKYFNLDYNQVLRILNKYIKPNYSDIRYQITTSNSTNSIYIKFYRNNVFRIVRLSDHPSFKNNLDYHYVGKSTRESKIVNIFLNAIGKLKDASLYRKYNNI